MGVLGTVSSLIGPNDIIVIDKLDHASIIDAAFGAVSGRRQVHTFRHNNMNNLESVLKSVNTNRKAGVMIITEGVYGMTGDLAKLKDICELKERYDARLFIDDAHGVGVMGKDGRGTGEHFGVQDKIDVFFGTFAKAFASIGGFSSSSKDVVEWIRYNARSQVFAKSLPMVYIKSLIKTLELVRNGHERRKKMFDIAAKLSKGLKELGYYVGKVESPIVPVIIPDGTNNTAMEWIRYLREKGIFVSAVVYPVIPRGFAMFRMIPTASHNDEDVAMTVAAFKDLRDDKNLTLTVQADEIARLYGGSEV